MRATLATDAVRAILCVLLIVLGAAGCGDDGSSTQPGPPDDGGAVSFAADIQPIFTTRCAMPGCHLGGDPAGGLTLEAGLSYDALVGVESEFYDDPAIRVDPGDPTGSLLLLKVQGASGVGQQMPPVGGALSSTQIGLVETWIIEGAEEN